MISKEIKPYNNSSSGKKNQVRSMFNNIAHKYDFLNHFLSFGVDKYWRRKVVRLLKEQSPRMILDVSTGTGDLAIEALKLNPERIVGIDISAGMLNIAKSKVRAKEASNFIELHEGDAEQIDFKDKHFDAVTVAFGVRNFEDLDMGLREMHRVLKIGGQVVILEFSKPNAFFVKCLYFFYMSWLLPVLGRIFSRDKFAYTYLPRSVKAFPEKDAFVRKLEKAGFEKTNFYSLTFGIVCIYVGRKY